MAKRALVVGINAYDPPNALPSCIADADSFEALLRTRYGFVSIANLRDREASKIAILDGLRSLLAGAQPGDDLVFYFSGHGYSFQQGNALVDALVPQDADFLTSDDMADVTATAPPGTLTCVLDSCYSGGLQKVFAFAESGVKPTMVKVWTPPPAEVSKAFAPHLASICIRRCLGEAPVPFLSPWSLTALDDTKAFSLVPPPISGIERHFILLSACRNDETAAASTDRTSGRSAFTFCLLDQIAQSDSGVGVERLIDATGQELRQLGLGQTPMLKIPARPTGLIDHPFLLWDSPTTGSAVPAGPPLGTVTPSATSSKGFVMTSFNAAPQAGFDKDWVSDLTSIIQTVVPVVAGALKDYRPPSKDFTPQAQSSVDKGFFDDLSRVVATVIPALVQGMKDFEPPSKGFAPGPAEPFDKGWFDNITAIVAAVVPEVVGALKTYQTPNGTLAPLADAARKGWFEDVTHVVASVLPVIISATKDLKVAGAPAAKGFQPPVDDKSWLSVLGDIAKVAAPIALSLL